MSAKLKGLVFGADTVDKCTVEFELMLGFFVLKELLFLEFTGGTSKVFIGLFDDLLLA